MVLPAMFTDLQGPWRFWSVASSREIRCKIRQMLVEVQFLKDHLFTESLADLTMTVKVFLEGTLAQDVQTELMSVLKDHHSADLAPIFHNSDDFAQILAYPLESVLRNWLALNTKRCNLQPSEFKGFLPWSLHGAGGSVFVALVTHHVTRWALEGSPKERVPELYGGETHLMEEPISINPVLAP
jgi:hypothetical protein